MRVSEAGSNWSLTHAFGTFQPVSSFWKFVISLSTSVANSLSRERAIAAASCPSWDLPKVTPRSVKAMSTAP